MFFLTLVYLNCTYKYISQPLFYILHGMILKQKSYYPNYFAEHHLDQYLMEGEGLAKNFSTSIYWKIYRI